MDHDQNIAAQGQLKIGLTVKQGMYDKSINNIQFYEYSDKSNIKDSDGDGLSDEDEENIFQTDPLKRDTDNNGIDDGDEDFDKDNLTNLQEMEHNTDPFCYDTDDDGLSDSDELYIYFTNPNIPDTDGDGIREMNGKNISLRYITYENRRLSDFAQAIQTQLKDLGIDVKIDSMNADKEWNLMVAGEYDLCDSNWITVGNGDPTEYLANWYGKSDANFCNYKNDKFDKLYEQLETEFDEAKRAKIIEQLQQILIDDAAVVVHGYYNSSIISDKTVTGADIHTADYYWLTTEIAPAK